MSAAGVSLPSCLRATAQENNDAAQSDDYCRKKLAKPAITKTRKVGEDGFVWYELKKAVSMGRLTLRGKR